MRSAGRTGTWSAGGALCTLAAMSTALSERDQRSVAEALRRLKATPGSHSPSVGEVERVLPGLVEIDACFLCNPYATAEAMTRLFAIPARQLERMVSHYPSQSGAVASLLAPYAGVPAEQLCVANGACEVIQALLARAPGPLILSLPTFSAYYELAAGPVVPHRLDPRAGFRLDLDALERLVERYSPDTVVIINPNNPDGGPVGHAELVDFVARLHGRVQQVIVDESFGAFTTDGVPDTLAPLVGTMPHLVVVNSLSKSHGIAGLRLGYAVAHPELRDYLDVVQEPFNVNRAALAAGYASVGQTALVEERRRENEAARERLAALLREAGAEPCPSEANFLLVRVGDDETALADRLLRRGLLVRPGRDFGMPGYIRVTIGPVSVMERLAAEVARALGGEQLEGAARA
jgi:histidinol-phosphate aminotransferase